MKNQDRDFKSNHIKTDTVMNTDTFASVQLLKRH